jgi:hypothetical protein
MHVEPATCPVCGGSYDPLRSRAVAVLNGKVRAFCSPTCMERGRTGVEQAPSLASSLESIQPPPRWNRRSVSIASGIGLVALSLIVVAGRSLSTAPMVPASIASPAHASKPPGHTPTAAEAMAMLAPSSPEENDVWIHPLAAPRHLPERNSRRFGAPREGLRPEECAGGHCGVDIGTVRGDVVMASHDGVVERVERDPEVGGRRGNEGRFIRINHKGGTIVTSYIHLDGIRDDLRPGVPVKMGEPIGTVGDTGVHNSGPHLHFAVSVRASVDDPELFIDPEPMLHLWPVRSKPLTNLHGMEPTPHSPSKTAKADSPTPG